MGRFYKTLAGLFVVFVSTLSIVNAQVIPNPISDDFKDLPHIINWSSRIVLPISTIILIGIIIYAGYLKLTSMGNPDKEKKFMQTLTSGILGYAMILSSTLIIGIIGAFFGIRLLGIA